MGHIYGFCPWLLAACALGQLTEFLAVWLLSSMDASVPTPTTSIGWGGIQKNSLSCLLT